MIEGELRETAAEWAERTAIEQRLPRIDVLRDVMRLMGLLTDEQPRALKDERPRAE